MKYVKTENFVLLIVDLPVEKTFCYDDNQGRFTFVGPFEPGQLVELPPSCAEALVRKGYAHVASVDEVVKKLREMGVKEDTIRWLMQHLEKNNGKHEIEEEEVDEVKRV